MNCYRFIEAEKAGRRNVARACALLKVSRAACCQHLAGPSRRDRADAELPDREWALANRPSLRIRRATAVAAWSGGHSLWLDDPEWFVSAVSAFLDDDSAVARC